MKINTSEELWSAYDDALDQLGSEELCLALAKAMGEARLKEELEYIYRMYDLEA